VLYAGLRLPVWAGQKESGRSQLVAAPEEFEGLRNHPAAGSFRRTSSRVGVGGPFMVSDTFLDRSLLPGVVRSRC